MNKKLLLSLTFLLFSLSNYAQLFNSDFEGWKAYTNYNDPDSFTTPNAFTNTFLVYLIEKSASGDAYHGNFSCKLSSKTVFGNDYPGVITNGSINQAAIISGSGSPVIGGRPITQKPNYFSGYYKFSPAGPDTCAVSVIMTKWNSVTHKKDTLGTGKFIDTLLRASWTKWLIPINYTLTGTPDTFQLMFASGNLNAVTPGTVFQIDSMNFDIPVSGPVTPGGFSALTINPLSISPNPVNDILVINNQEAIMKQITITNTLGEQVYSTIANQKSFSINTSSFSNGTYFIRATDHAGAVYVAKFVKE